MKQLLIMVAATLLCGGVAVANDNGSPKPDIQVPSSRPGAKANLNRKGWDNKENPLYGNVATVTLRKKDMSQGVGLVYHHVVYTFNGAGDMVEEKYYTDESGEMTETTVKYEYHASGMTKRYTHLKNSGEVLGDFTFEDTPAPAERFPASEVAGKTIKEDLYDDFGDRQGTEERRFDAAGRITYYKQVSDFEGVLREENWAYDDKGRLTMYELAVDAYDMEGGYRKEQYSYDAKGRKSETLYTWMAGGDVALRAVYKYDVQGNLTKVTLYNSDGTVRDTDEYQIRYR